MKRNRPKVGDVVQLTLPSGRYAYGRVLRDGGVAFYCGTTSEPDKPPIGSRDYQFVVGVYDHVLKSADCPIVGRDPSSDPEDDWPPPWRITDPISKEVSLYHKGVIRPATQWEVRGLEPAAAWDHNHLIERLEKCATEG